MMLNSETLSTSETSIKKLPGQIRVTKNCLKPSWSVFSWEYDFRFPVSSTLGTRSFAHETKEHFDTSCVPIIPLCNTHARPMQVKKQYFNIDH